MSILYISEQGSYLRKQGGRYVIRKGDDELASIPKAAVERVVVLGNCQLSTQAMNELLGSGVEVVFLGINGQFKGVLEPGYPKNVFVRLAQYERTLETDYSTGVATALIDAKLRNSQSIHTRWTRNGWRSSEVGAADETLADALATLRDCQNAADVRGREAVAARAHFAILAETLPPPFEWRGRNRRPPRDPVNALLSLTYMLTLGHLVSACYCHGLDPFIGFLHELDYSRPSLALDLLEPLRPHCDHFVMRRLQREDFTPGDFQNGEQLGCRLTPSAFRCYIEFYQAFLDNKTGGGAKPLAKGIDDATVELATAVRERRLPCVI